MDELCVQRRLVKSPPELWAEVSDADALSRHLDHFGEIRISRLEPENTVAWEGDHASGTVVLDPAGWGTRVTLTAAMRSDMPEAGADATADGTVPTARPREDTIGDTTPVAATEQAGGPAVDPPAAAPTDPPAPAPRRPGFFARLFGRGRVQAAPAPVALDPGPPPVAADPELIAAPVEPLPEPEPALDPAAAESALEHVLDALGAAHHRPFSR